MCLEVAGCIIISDICSIVLYRDIYKKENATEKRVYNRFYNREERLQKRLQQRRETTTEKYTWNKERAKRALPNWPYLSATFSPGLHDLAHDNGSLRSPQYMHLYISFFYSHHFWGLIVKMYSKTPERKKFNFNNRERRHKNGKRLQ